MGEKAYDILSLGRCSMDLYSQQVGAPFANIESFSAMVGGSPTNMAIGTSRLGLRSGAVTAVGRDLVGDFVRRNLAKEGVVTDFLHTKNGRTALAILGVQPPANFPLVFYRDDPPDQYLSIEDIQALPLADTAIVVMVGSNFSLPNLRDASLYAAKIGREAGATVVLDLDLRPSLWLSPEALRLNMQTIMPLCDVVIGTEEEFWSALSPDSALVWTGRTLPEEKRPMLDEIIKAHQDPGQAVILKRGPRGATIFLPGEETVDVPGFPVKVLNTVGAGDAFASGLLYGRRQGWDWQSSARFGNACGAIVVTRHGCSTAMPTRQEVADFISKYS